MSHVSTITAARRWLPVALALALAACSGKEESAAPAPAAAPTAAAPAAPVVAAKVQSMGTEQLRESASQALRENRMYAPAGDNAIEYYLALRDKTPDDASVKSALTDLLPYTLIAAEQHLGREDYTEAQRLVALIEKVDASAPALPRLKDGLARACRTRPSAPRPKPRRPRRTPRTAASSRPNSSAWPSSVPRKPTRPSRSLRSRMPPAATTSARKPSARPPRAAKPN